jgi:hypothetical protein
MTSPLHTRIKTFLTENRTSDALALLLEESRPNEQVHDAIHVVLGEFNELTSNRLRGVIDDSEAALRLNIIHNKILIALSSFDSEGKPLPGSEVSGSVRTPKFLLQLGLYILGAALLLTTLAFISNGNAMKYLLAAGYFLGMGGFFVLGIWLLSLVVSPVKGR